MRETATRQGGVASPGNARLLLGRFSRGLPYYLFAAVFLVRLISLTRLSATALLLPAKGDMHFYNEWALRILHGAHSAPGAFYGLPLYPYLLAALYRLFGYTPFVPGLLQVALDAGTAVLIYQLVTFLVAQAASARPQAGAATGEALPVGGKLWGAVGALAWAFYVPAQAYSIVLMPTSGVVFVFWLVVWWIIKRETLSWQECLGLGLLIGVSAMAVATILFLLPLLFGALLIRRKDRIGRSFLPKAALCLVGVALGTSPCWIHNCVVARDPVFLSAHGGINFWIGNNPYANGYPRFPPGLRAGQAAMLEDSIASAEAAAGHPLKRSQVSAYWSEQARTYIARHFASWLKLLLVKLRNFWSAFQYDDISVVTILRSQKVILPGLYFGLVAALGLAGMLIAWRIAPASRWITAAILLQMIALLSVFVTERYRVPAVPGLLALGAFGVSIFWRSLLTGRYRVAGIYLAALTSATLFVSWPQRDPSLWALDSYNSGWQALECGNLALAEQNLSLARRYVPGNPETNFALGNLRLAQGKLEGAASFYLTTLQYDPDHRGALNNLAVMALNAHRYDMAEMWLRRAEHVDERNAKTHFLLAKAMLGKGDRASARLEIERAIGLAPNQPEFAAFEQSLAASPR
jgi:tetratricopeptide (TPR) repeat protein